MFKTYVRLDLKLGRRMKKEKEYKRKITRQNQQTKVSYSLLYPRVINLTNYVVGAPGQKKAQVPKHTPVKKIAPAHERAPV